MNITIISSRQSHLVDLRKLFLEVRQKTFSWKDSSSFRLDDFDSETKGERVLIALCNAEIAGFISVWLPDNFVHHLFVYSRFQNLGVGSKLLEKAITKFGLPISLKCLERNNNAVEFYKRKGFTAKATGGEGDNRYIFFELD